MNEKLPPLPAPNARRPNNLVGPATGNIDYYTAEQVEAIRREAVMLCARICERQLPAWGDEAPPRAAIRMNAAAIRALLEEAPQSHSGDSGHSISAVPSEVVPEPGSTADHCKQLGLSVGDTIFGREEGGVGYWHEAKLTLLWVGCEEAVWRVEERSESWPEWRVTDRESGDWCLTAREWKKVDRTVEAKSERSVKCPESCVSPSQSVRIGGEGEKL